MPSFLLPTRSGWQTLTRSILFQGGAELFLEDLFLTSGNPSIEVSERIRAWRVRGIHDIFLLLSDPELTDQITQRLKSAGENVTVLPANITELTPSALRAVNMHLLSRLARGNAVLVVSRDLADSARVLATTLALTPTGGKLSVPDAVKLVAGRGIFESLDKKVLEYAAAIEATTPGLTAAPPQKKKGKAGPMKSVPSETTGGVKTAAAERPVVQPATVPVPESAPMPEKVPAPEKKSMPTGPPPERKSDFKRSALTIRIKLLGIISGIIIGALITMILLASKFFKDDSETRIKENSLNLTEVIGLKVQSELEGISYRAQSMAASMEEGDPAGAATELFLRNNQNFAFLGLAEAQGQSLRFTRTLYNQRFLDDNKLKREDVEKLHASAGAQFAKSFTGATVVQNVSPGFSIPLLGMSTPSSSGRSIIVLYLEPGDFLKTFKASGITVTFLVGENGDVIAHPEQEMVMSRTNLANLEIVKQMLESRSNNQQLSYQDKDGKRFIGNFKKLAFAGLGVISTVPESDAFQAVERIRYRNFLIMALVLVAAIFIVYFFSKTITVPIGRLVNATGEIERENYRLELKPSSGDEIGILTHSFVNMAIGMEERQKMKDALGRYSDPRIAEMILSGQLKAVGDRKDAAIFFSDLRGFTAMSEAMEPEEVVEFLNEYFTGMVACVSNTHGVVDKFIGDAIMAHWGALFSEGNDTENAVNAALLMRQNLKDFNSRPVTKSGKKKPPAQFGCGINTGPVISGELGSESRKDYTVIGDAVNLASRIEALNKPFGTDVLISADSYERVKGIFAVVEMPAIKVKGKSEAQVIYCVLGRMDDPSRPKTVEEMREQVGIKFGGEKPKAEVLDGGGEVKYEIIGDKPGNAGGQR